MAHNIGEVLKDVVNLVCHGFSNGGSIDLRRGSEEASYDGNAQKIRVHNTA
jgi:hypothetical protein